MQEVQITDKAAIDVKCGVSNIHLNLKSVWFDLILDGKKKEEYREIKPFFQKMFCTFFLNSCNVCNNKDCPTCFKTSGSSKHKDYKTITFSNGYSKNRRQFVIELLSIKIDTGKQEWGAKPNEKYFVLQLGNIISSNCC